MSPAEVFCQIMAAPDKPDAERCDRCLAPRFSCRCEKAMVCDPND